MKQTLLTLFLLISIGLSQEEYHYANIAYSDGRYLLKSGDLIFNVPIHGEVYMFVGGKKVIMGQSVFGKLEGEWTYWHENGQKSAKGIYKDGIDDGLSMRWYDNGQKKAEGTLKNGKRDGLIITWYENGQLKSKETYKDGDSDCKGIP